MLKKYKPNGENEFAPVYFNSVTKTVINHKFRLENSFQEMLYMINVWLNNGSGWNVESVESEYINISFYGAMLDILILQKNTQKELKKLTKKLLKKLIIIEFNKIEVKNNICIDVSSYENKLAFSIYVSDHSNLCFRFYGSAAFI